MKNSQSGNFKVSKNARFSGAGQILLLVFIMSVVIFLCGTRVLAFSNGQQAVRVIGQEGFTTNMSSARIGLASPEEVAFDPLGNLWVTDTGNNRVLEFKPPFSNGEPPSLVIGQPSFFSDIKSVTPKGLFFPQQAVFDPSGNLWVADSGNNRVLEFKPPFSNDESAALVIGQTNFTTDENSTTGYGLEFPEQIAFDSAGNLWIPDTGNNRVLEFKPPFSNGEDASLVIGQQNFTANSGVTSRSGLDGPAQVAFDIYGNMWVLDTANNRVLEFKPPFSNGEDASLVIGQKNFVVNFWAPTRNMMYTPAGIAFDQRGNLWVSDSYYNRVLEFKPPFSNGEDASAVIGQTTFTAGNPATTVSGLRGPVGVVFDHAGNLWVADIANNRVLEYAGSPLPSHTIPEFPYGSTVVFTIAALFVTFRLSSSRP